MKSDAEYLKEQLDKYLGYVLRYTVVATDEYDDEEWLEFFLVNPLTGHKVGLSPSRDPEGNGPGWLYIEGMGVQQGSD